MRPYVTVNFAMSADGKLSTAERRQVKISGPADFLRVDRLKAESDAIMVGIGTVLADDPSLTVKSEELRRWRSSLGKDENPVRVVVDSTGRTPPDASLLRKGPGKRVIGCSRTADPVATGRLARYADIIVAGDDKVDLGGLLGSLFRTGIKTLMVEGGGTLLWSLFEEGLVDEMFQFVGNIVIGGSESPTPADGTGFLLESQFTRMELISSAPLDEGVLLHWKVKRARDGAPSSPETLGE
ncbi:MAG TPA: 2,5-diamino-6-(ribosylamino)-4(3H)-pyrimidinone 5'-phosphate reductase [Methanoregulaceae archaeon]|nr:2,5-diamino-6-(ribosylamino)-4(3H)-pyrimidinone 5'-phosphate reductase [Methanoregulaceae archaeon]